RNRRTISPPARQAELVTLTTSSGQSLTVSLREPRGASRGTVILLHSMMASRTMFDAPRGQGLAHALVERGLRTLSLDFRGHGGRWGYDDLVREDLPALARAARDRWPGERLSVVGHSLGGHVAAASVATGVADVDAIVVLATNVWLPQFEGNPVTRAKKQAIV